MPFVDIIAPKAKDVIEARRKALLKMGFRRIEQATFQDNRIKVRGEIPPWNTIPYLSYQDALEIYYLPKDKSLLKTYFRLLFSLPYAFKGLSIGLPPSRFIALTTKAVATERVPEGSYDPGVVIAIHKPETYKLENDTSSAAATSTPAHTQTNTPLMKQVKKLTW